MELLERLSPTYWWADPRESIAGPLYVALAIVLGVAFVVGVFAWILAPRLAGGHRLRQRLVVRLARAIIVLAVVGLLLLLFRWQLVPFFSKRLWFFLWVLSIFGTIGYAWYYLKWRYPVALAGWESAERRRRYLPRGGQSTGRSRRRGRRRR